MVVCMKYDDLLKKHENTEEAELEFLTRCMDRLERIQSEVGEIVGEIEQMFMEKKAACERKKKDKAA